MQEDLKRLLAYSSIAHAGYLMIGVTVAFANGRHGTELYLGTEGILFYLVAYALMTLGAFGVIIGLRIGDRRVETVRQLTGLGWTQPWPASAMAICLLSLSGIPPLLGFWGKFEIFASALAAQGLDDSWSFLVLAILGVLNSAVGAYYYLRIVVLMYLVPAKEELRFAGRLAGGRVGGGLRRADGGPGSLLGPGGRDGSRGRPRRGRASRPTTPARRGGRRHAGVTLNRPAHRQ